MFDTFDYPNITSTDPKEQIKELQNYLVQFKETLEFALMNISGENLSTELQAQLMALGTDAQANKKEQEDQIQQIANKSSITVFDVINSQAYKSSLKAVEDKIPTVYLASVEQTQSSEEAGGINIYAFTDAGGTVKEFQVKNGNTPKVTLTVNFDTGNLEYEQT